MGNNNKQNNTIAIVGFILSFFIAIPALICSIIGLKKSKELNNGKGFSIAGIIISSIKIVLGILVTVILILAYYIGDNIVVEEKPSIIENEEIIKPDSDISDVYSSIEHKEFEEGSNEYYLSLVPFETDSDYYYCTWNSDIFTCKNYKEWKDAYSSEKTINSDISDNLLFKMSLKNATDVTETDRFESDFKICGDRKCALTEYYKANEVINIIKTMYNITIQPNDFIVDGGVAYYKNGYFVIGYGAGNYPAEKINKVVDSEKKDDEYIITERVLFIFDYIIAKDEIPVITKKTNYKEDDIIQEYSKNTDVNDIEQYAKDNIDKGSLFKHVFKFNKDTNEYYWYSTEVIG